ncbi:flavin reductase family protein [Pseudonocardia benzenivorans]
MGQFATGVTVITTTTAAGPVGATVSAFCSLSLDPPLVLACLGRDRSMHRALSTAPGFGVSILAADQGRLARDFARPADRFAGVAHHPGRYGPHLDGAIAHLDCAVHEIRDGGDHVIILGRVDAVAVHPGNHCSTPRAHSSTSPAPTGNAPPPPPPGMAALRPLVIHPHTRTPPLLQGAVDGILHRHMRQDRPGRHRQTGRGRRGHPLRRR